MIEEKSVFLAVVGKKVRLTLMDEQDTIRKGKVKQCFKTHIVFEDSETQRTCYINEKAIALLEPLD